MLRAQAEWEYRFECVGVKIGGGVLKFLGVHLLSNMKREPGGKCWANWHYQGGGPKEHLRGRAWRVPERGPQKPSEITAVVLSWRWTCERSFPAFVRAAAVRAWLPHHTWRGGFSLPSSPSLPPRCSLQLSLHGGQDSLPHPRARVIWSSGWLLTWPTGLQAVWEICSLSNAWLSGLSRYPILNVRSCILAVSIAPTPPPLLSSVRFQMPGDALVGPLRDTGICRDRSHRGDVDDMGEGEVTAWGSGEALKGWAWAVLPVIPEAEGKGGHACTGSDWESRVDPTVADFSLKVEDLLRGRRLKEHKAGYSFHGERHQEITNDWGKRLGYIVFLVLFTLDHFFSEYIFIRFLYHPHRPISFQGTFFFFKRIVLNLVSWSPYTVLV